MDDAGGTSMEVHCVDVCGLNRSRYGGQCPVPGSGSLEENKSDFDFDFLLRFCFSSLKQYDIVFCCLSESLMLL